MNVITSRLESRHAATLLLTRVLVAAIFLWHGLPKAVNPAMAHEKFIQFGLPGGLGPMIGWIEVVASLLLLVGYFHRWSALALTVIITGALITVQIPGGFTAGLERDLLILASTLILAGHGPGLFSIDHVISRHRVEATHNRSRPEYRVS